MTLRALGGYFTFSFCLYTAHCMPERFKCEAWQAENLRTQCEGGLVTIDGVSHFDCVSGLCMCMQVPWEPILVQRPNQAHALHAWMRGCNYWTAVASTPTGLVTPR